MAPHYKPVGGVERVVLYPANAVHRAIFSSEGCRATLLGEALEVELLDDASSFEEVVECHNGTSKIEHRLNLVADRGDAEDWMDADFLERAAIEGVVAVVELSDGRSLLVGYSSRFGCEQPLRLRELSSASGSKLHDTPTVTLQLVSCDTEFSCRINKL